MEEEKRRALKRNEVVDCPTGDIIKAKNDRWLNFLGKIICIDRQTNYTMKRDGTAEYNLPTTLRVRIPRNAPLTYTNKGLVAGGLMNFDAGSAGTVRPFVLTSNQPKNYGGLVPDSFVSKMTARQDCRNTQQYFNHKKPGAWCKHFVLQRCLTTNPDKHNQATVDTVVVMEMMSGDIQQLIAKQGEAGVPDLDPAAKDRIIEQVHKAIVCLDKYGGIYPDMKPANVMFKDVDLQLIKMVDLESICPAGSGPRGVATYPPPVAWPIVTGVSVQVNAGGVPCNVNTSIWEMAVFALQVLTADEQDSFMWRNPSLDNVARGGDLRWVNRNIMRPAYEAIEEIMDAGTSTLYLDKLLECFEDIRGGDWRTGPRAPGFTLESMFAADYF